MHKASLQGPVWFLMILMVGLVQWFTADRVEAGNEQSPDTGLCLQCHSTRIKGGHPAGSGVQAPCLACHSPHSRTSNPYITMPGKERCSACHMEYSSEGLRQKEQGLYRLHQPAARQECSMCHLPHELGSPARYWGGSKDAACARCHQKELRDPRIAVQHEPFRARSCTSCHDPHGSREEPLLRLPVAELCVSCHRNRQDEQDLPVQHTPFQQGHCIECHGAHGTGYQKNLADQVPRLCEKCHTAPARENPVQHPPYREKACTLCHTPHASKAAGLLRAASQKELCSACHPGVVGEYSLRSRHPVGTQLECTNCHVPHSGAYPRLLRAESRFLCGTCHPGQNAMIDRMAHARLPFGLNSCTTCHQPHGSSNSTLLRKPPHALCTQCHNHPMARAHPMGESVLDPIRGQPVTCASCHNPHGSPNQRALRTRGDALCDLCHPE